MTGPGDEVAAGGMAGRGRLRASDADREQVISTLQAAFVQGMLSKDELVLRAGQAFASRTYADLAALTGDLPAGLAAAEPEPVGAEGRPGVRKVVIWGGSGMLIPAMLGLALLTGSGFFVALFLLAAISYFGAVLLAAAEKLDSWHRDRSRGQLPPRPAQRGLALGGEQDSGLGDDLILFEARRAALARRVHNPLAPFPARAAGSRCSRARHPPQLRRLIYRRGPDLPGTSGTISGHSAYPPGCGPAAWLPLSLVAVGVSHA
jgi:hypothetical protein